ncbi:MAG: Peptidyl-prolyl cis-trans isomerase (rotamase) - cyclophilin family [Bacteroidetes bacterium]|nr:Peptidyl-prolyl cis-trans isomerase (rotamase) - cyclophilin family [Bacteroidota bacterium]
MKHSAVRSTAMMALAVALAYATTAGFQKTKKAEDKKSKMEHVREIGVIETSMGTVEVEFYRNDAPKTVENFVRLAEERKYFDGMRFHRVSKNFVIQAGDVKSKDTNKVSEWGTGGQSIWGKEFADELNPNAPSFKEGYKKGVLAMANRGPNTNTSQFFVMLRDNTSLPKNYTIFGKVVKGMDVVDAIGKVDIIPGQMGPTDGRPKVDVLIKKISIRKEPLPIIEEKK